MAPGFVQSPVCGLAAAGAGAVTWAGAVACASLVVSETEPPSAWAADPLWPVSGNAAATVAVPSSPRRVVLPNWLFDMSSSTDSAFAKHGTPQFRSVCASFAAQIRPG